MEKAKMKGEGYKFSFKLGIARQAEEKALKLASEVETLFYWLRLDILSLAGNAYQERQELMDFIISELTIREEGSYKGIKANWSGSIEAKLYPVSFFGYSRPKTARNCPSL